MCFWAVQLHRGLVRFFFALWQNGREDFHGVVQYYTCTKDFTAVPGNLAEKFRGGEISATPQILVFSLLLGAAQGIH